MFVCMMATRTVGTRMQCEVGLRSMVTVLSRLMLLADDDDDDVYRCVTDEQALGQFQDDLDGVER